MATIADTLRAAQDRLSEATDTPRIDAEILLAEALKVSRSQLLTRLAEDCPDTPDFEAMLARREKSEPIAYILGEWEFFSLPLYVEPPVLVPRPETEHLVEAAIAFFLEHGGEAPRILDMGTGTGCIAIACLKNLPRATCTATDIRPQNLALAQKNAQRHDVEDRLTLIESDAFQAIPAEPTFHAILSNPPYIADADRPNLPPAVRDYEDPTALFAGSQGLDMIHMLVAESPSCLLPGGMLAVEIGAGQHHNVIAQMEQQGFTDVNAINDLAGIPRIITGLKLND